MDPFYGKPSCPLLRRKPIILASESSFFRHVDVGNVQRVSAGVLKKEIWGKMNYPPLSTFNYGWDTLSQCRTSEFVAGGQSTATRYHVQVAFMVAS
jgi:hypothetical protein